MARERGGPRVFDDGPQSCRSRFDGRRRSMPLPCTTADLGRRWTVRRSPLVRTQRRRGWSVRGRAGQRGAFRSRAVTGCFTWNIGRSWHRPDAAGLDTAHLPAPRRPTPQVKRQGARRIGGAGGRSPAPGEGRDPVMCRQDHQGWSWVQGRSEVPRSGRPPREARSSPRVHPGPAAVVDGQRHHAPVRANPRPAENFASVALLQRACRRGWERSRPSENETAQVRPREQDVFSLRERDAVRRPVHGRGSGNAGRADARGTRGGRGADRSESEPARSRPAPSGVFHVKRRA